jgi:hypothetical protein
MNFKSKASYRRWLAYGHMHGAFAKAKGNQRITIRGRPHRVIHTKINRRIFKRTL